MKDKELIKKIVEVERRIWKLKRQIELLEFLKKLIFSFMLLIGQIFGGLMQPSQAGVILMLTLIGITIIWK